jgi:hypothetical protein
MDRIDPIEPRPSWVPPIAPARPERISRERREQALRERREPGSRRRAPGEDARPDDDGPEGRHVDIRA